MRQCRIMVCGLGRVCYRHPLTIVVLVPLSGLEIKKFMTKLSGWGKQRDMQTCSYIISTKSNMAQGHWTPNFKKYCSINIFLLTVYVLSLKFFYIYLLDWKISCEVDLLTSLQAIKTWVVLTLTVSLVKLFIHPNFIPNSITMTTWKKFLIFSKTVFDNNNSIHQLHFRNGRHNFWKMNYRNRKLLQYSTVVWHFIIY